MNIEPYFTYSNYLNSIFGEKVYKLPIKLDLTCPNRDGTCGTGGCIFCGEEGGSFENLSNSLSIKEQINLNKSYIRNKYKASKFIAYFQNFTNTYLPLNEFIKNTQDALIDDVVGISISTRPDCVPDDYLDYLGNLTQDYLITLELGLQTTNYHTLKKINRGHSLAEFIDAVLRARRKNIRVCTHVILNLPWDNIDDVIEMAKILNVLDVNEVKLHSLYILDNTVLGDYYKKSKIRIISKEEYIQRVIIFLQYLNPDIVVQRLIGRAPEENSLFVNWSTSWWKIRDEIVNRMKEQNLIQGQFYNKI